MKSNKFVIIGPALSGNKGAAAMLESSIQTLTKKYPDAKFTLLSHYPEADKKLNSYKNLKIVSATPLQLGLAINPLALLYFLIPPLRQSIKNWSPAVKEIAEADVLLDQGGITFNDGREVFLLFNVATLLPAIFTRTKIVKCAQALGPFKNPINRFVSKIILPKVGLIVARGDYTRKNLDALKLKNVVDGADYAFSLEVTAKSKETANKILKNDFYKVNKPLVGVSPSVVIKKRIEKQGLDYTKINVDFINQLTKNGYKVFLTPHSVRANSEKTHNNDLPLCKNIYAQLERKENVLFVDKELSAQVLRVLIGKCDVFVASRFHAMVASLAMSVPVMVVGWSHKYAEVLRMFDSEELSADYKNMSAQKLSKNFDKIFKNRESIAAKISQNLPEVKKLSKKHVNFIDQVLIKN